MPSNDKTKLPPNDATNLDAPGETETRKTVDNPANGFERDPNRKNDLTDVERVTRHIIAQWQGGEHANAGKRASLLLHAHGSDDLRQRLLDECPGISEYFVGLGIGPTIANATAVERQQTAAGLDPNGGGDPNQSSAAGTAELTAIDKVLGPAIEEDAKAAQKIAADKAAAAATDGSQLTATGKPVSDVKTDASADGKAAKPKRGKVVKDGAKA